jgi:hypothetical protein
MPVASAAEHLEDWATTWNNTTEKVATQHNPVHRAAIVAKHLVPAKPRTHLLHKFKKAVPLNV